MRGSMRRAEKCWQLVGERYSAYLQTLTEDEFAAECRRMYTGYTREQFLEVLGAGGTTPDFEEARRTHEFVDKVFEGRQKL